MMRVGIAVLLLLLGAGIAQAQIPDKERQFVYGINAFAWNEYAGSLSPRAHQTIYLLAGYPSIVSPKETLVYFWPITGEYRADWSGLNVDVAGTLEVRRGERVVATLQSRPYIIQYPEGPAGPPVLYTGEEAKRRYRAFVETRLRYRDALERYSEERRRYIEALDNAAAARRRGRGVTLPPPPVEPAPFRSFSTEIHAGFVINLPPGHYAIQTRAPDGRIVAGSGRSLIVFTHRRQSAGFTVVPETRWTVPERADDPFSTIYARRDQVLYLQPFAAREYNDLAYTRLAAPESREGRPDGRRWQYTGALSGARLRVEGGSRTETILARAFRVEQTAGEALGYQVVEPKVDERADFTAFRIRIQGPAQIVLLDEAGRPIPGGERIVRVPRQGPAWPLGLIALIPLTIGAAVVSWRRDRLGRTTRPREG